MVTPSIARLYARRRPGQPVRFEMTEQTREAVDSYIGAAGKKPGERTEFDDPFLVNAILQPLP